MVVAAGAAVKSSALGGRKELGWRLHPGSLPGAFLILHSLASLLCIGTVKTVLCRRDTNGINGDERVPPRQGRATSACCRIAGPAGAKRTRRSPFDPGRARDRCRYQPMIFLPSPDILLGANHAVGTLGPAVLELYLFCNVDELYMRNGEENAGR